MSSSRIIKLKTSEDQAPLQQFNFMPISHSGSATPVETFIDSFIPLGLFDSTDLTGGGAAGALAAVEENPGILMDEEELNARLNEAFQNGLKEGKNLAERGLLNIFKALRTACEDVHSLREKIFRESEDELLSLIMMVARKVILREVAQDRSILSDVVKNALVDISDRDEITIRLNPDDFAQATVDRGEVLNKEMFSERVRLKPDPAIPAGSCQIDTEMGTVDASIDSQLDEIYRRLLEERSTTAGDGA